MNMAIATLLAMSLCYAGMTGMCLAMARHQRQVFSRGAPGSGPLAQLRAVLLGKTSMRIVGLLLLALALWPNVLVWGYAVGAVVWLGYLSGAALVLVGLLPFAPRIALAAAVLAPLATMGMWWSCGS